MPAKGQHWSYHLQTGTTNALCSLPKTFRVVWDHEAKLLKVRRESTLELFLLHFLPLEGWISDKNAELLSLGADEAIAVSALSDPRAQRSCRGGRAA